MNLIISILVLLCAYLVKTDSTTHHPCSDQILIETRVISPDCSGFDGQIIFSNPDPSTAKFAWSHDDMETGHNVGNLDADTYFITVTVGSQVRVTTVVLE